MAGVRGQERPRQDLDIGPGVYGIPLPQRRPQPDANIPHADDREPIPVLGPCVPLSRYESHAATVINDVPTEFREDIAEIPGVRPGVAQLSAKDTGNPIAQSKQKGVNVLGPFDDANFDERGRGSVPALASRGAQTSSQSSESPAETHTDQVVPDLVHGESDGWGPALDAEVRDGLS